MGRIIKKKIFEYLTTTRFKTPFSTDLYYTVYSLTIKYPFESLPGLHTKSLYLATTKKKHVITGNMVCSGPDRGDGAPASAPVEGDPAFEEEDPWAPPTFQDSSPRAG